MIERTEDIFERARKLPEHERDAYLVRACAGNEKKLREIRRILSFDESDSDSESCFQRALRFDRPPETPERIGDYEIISLLGEGGMGQVYEARQSSPQRRVALKIIRADRHAEQSRERFDREVQILGSLRHPGIAQIHEAGHFESSRGFEPFFAMEYVDGLPLLEYLSVHDLDVPRRLDLLARIGDAMGYAHQRGVVHRDLKPNNILIDRNGDPKILDFGIAKSLSDQHALPALTQSSAPMGTVAYMSPEQVSNDPQSLSERSDVYALGLILYEVLTGRRPYVISNPLDASRIICEEEPTPMSSTDRRLRGELEAIVAKALAKDPIQRYETANELAADLRRFLQDRPIIARRPSSLYQLRKFARRNQILVGSVAVVLITLAIGMVVSLLMWLEAREQRELRDVSLTALYELIEPGELGADLSYGDHLETYGPRTLLKLEPDPESYFKTAVAIGNSLQKIGRYDPANEIFDTADHHLKEWFHEAPLESLVFRRERASLAFDQQASNAVRSEFEDVLRLMIDRVGVDHEEVARTQLDLSRVIRDAGDYPKAVDLIRNVLSTFERSLGEEHPETLAAKSVLAGVLGKSGQLESAVRIFRDLVPTQEKILGAHHLRSLTTKANFLNIHFRYEPSESLLEEFRLHLDTLKIRLGELHPQTLEFQGIYALYLMERGRVEDSANVYRESLAALEQTVGLEHPETLRVRTRLANYEMDRGDLIEAHKCLEAICKDYRDVCGPDHKDTLTADCDLAKCLYLMGKVESARAVYEESLVKLEPRLGRTNIIVLTHRSNLAFILTSLGLVDDGRKIFEDVLSIRRESLGDDHPSTLRTQSHLALALTEQGKLAKAIQLLETTLEQQTRILPSGHPHCVETRARLVESYRKHEKGLSNVFARLHDSEGLEDETTLEALEDLSALHVRMASYEAVIGNLASVIETAYQDHEPIAARLQLLYARALLSSKRLDEATRELEECQEFLNEYPEAVEARRDVLMETADLLDAADRPNNAASLRELIAEVSD